MATDSASNDPVVQLEERTRKSIDIVSLQEVLANYEIVGAENDSALVVAPKKMAAGQGIVVSATPDMRELGSSGATQWGMLARDDYNPELRGYMGMRKYDQMRKSDAQVRGSLRLAKTPILAARWYIQPATPAKRDQKIAEFIWDNLTKWMTSSWPQFLDEALKCLDFGFYCFEKVYGEAPDGSGKVIWQKLAPRHPMDLESWDYDDNGGPNGANFFNPDGGPPIFIPIDKLLVFTFDKEGGNMHGVSLLRSAYKHWYFKETLYKIDAIQKERHGIGIPVIKLPPNFTPLDKALAEEIGRNLRTNEKAHIVVPPNWEISFAQLLGNPVDCMASVSHHDQQIAKNVLAPFLGAGGASDQDADMFMKGSRYIADIVRDVFNKYCIPQLVNYNWPNVTDMPELRARRIGDDVDWRTISFALRNLVGADIISPDQPLEDWIRDEMDLPDFDPETVRIAQAPQAPGGSGPLGSPLSGQVSQEQPVPVDPRLAAQQTAAGHSADPKSAAGQAAIGRAAGKAAATASASRGRAKGAVAGKPRQSKARNMKQQAQGTGKKNTGQDRSGG